MKKILIASMVFALSWALIPPVVPSASACTQNLVDIDDSIVFCSNSTSGTMPAVRLNIRQNNAANFNHNFSFSTGNNFIGAGDDIEEGAAIVSGPVTFSFSNSYLFNSLTISIQ